MAHHDPEHTPLHNSHAPHGLTPFARLFIYAVVVADLFAVVYFGGTFLITGSLIVKDEPAKTVVAGAEAPAVAIGATPAAPAEKFDLATYVADPVKGAQIAAKCKACHNFDNGGPNRTGPNLWGIIGAPVEHKANFSYSDAMTAQKAKYGTWTEDHLFEFIANPKQVVPGTKMTFMGLPDPKDRADLIAWLKTLK